MAFDALAGMGALVNVDFRNNLNLKGSWLGNMTYNSPKQVSRRSILPVISVHSLRSRLMRSLSDRARVRLHLGTRSGLRLGLT